MNPEDPSGDLAELGVPRQTAFRVPPRCFDEAVGRATIEQLKIHIGIWKPQDIKGIHSKGPSTTQSNCVICLGWGG